MAETGASAMSGVEVAVAPRALRGALENLLQLYIHDFSEQWRGTPTGEIGDDGRFAPYPWLDAYWRDEGCVPLMVRRDGHLAGFALLNRHAHSGRPVDRGMAEFFIARKHRGSGLGGAAAGEIFRCYLGQWEVAVARRNLAALAFWRKTIGRHPPVRDLEEADARTDAWNGSIFRFRTDEAAS